ncbi:MAG: hypothetical protein NC299_01365 [Lachnospiraceae bacterium]|nr:hypothetical protein [Lachnospiraceae bacterium]
MGSSGTTGVGGSLGVSEEELDGGSGSEYTLEELSGTLEELSDAEYSPDELDDSGGSGVSGGALLSEELSVEYSTLSGALSGSEVSDEVLVLSGGALDDTVELLLSPAPLPADEEELDVLFVELVDELEDDEYMSVLETAPPKSITFSEGLSEPQPVSIIRTARAAAIFFGLFTIIYRTFHQSNDLCTFSITYYSQKVNIRVKNGCTDVQPFAYLLMS